MTPDRALQRAYEQALKESIVNLKQFFKKYNAVMTGMKAPPDYYILTGQVQFWRHGYIQALMRKYAVTQDIMKRLSAMRGTSNDIVYKHILSEYGHGRLQEIRTIIDGCKQFGFKPSFTRFDEKAIKAAVDDSLSTSPMAQIKVLDRPMEDGGRQYIDIQKDAVTRKRLQRQLAASIANGESQAKLIERIRGVFGVQASNYKRIAQTEGTRIRNQARTQTVDEARQMGIECRRYWQCGFQHSREGHMQVDGKPQSDDGTWSVAWVSGHDDGVDTMRYPGDPTAHAANVCNCHCTFVTRVKTASAAVARLREQNAERRQAWLDENAQQNNWRDRLFYDNQGNRLHPYARRDN